MEADAEGEPGVPSKPWKQRRSSRRRSSEAQQEPVFIEIFEGKPQRRGLSSIEPTPVETGYTKVQSEDGASFFVPTLVLKEAEQVKVMLEGSFRETVENIVQFQEIRGEVLEAVLRFTFTDYLNKAHVAQLYGDSGPRPRVAFNFEVAPALVMEIMSAAHFLGLKELLQLASSMVAHHLRDVPDISTLPKELAQVVAQHLSAEALLELEEREDFRLIGLDTSSMWQKHCQNRGWTGASSLGLVVLPELGDGFPFDQGAPDHWKQVFVTHDLHFASGLQTKETFPAFLGRTQSWGRFATFHMITHSLYADVLLPHLGSEGLARYLALFPDLRWLLLNRPDGSPSDSEVLLDGFDLAAVVRVVPCLRVLSVEFLRFWRLTPGQTLDFGEALQELKLCLESLKLAHNPMLSRNAWLILRGLRGSSVRVLDLSWCEIESCSAPADVADGLRGSKLETLVLSGNPLGKPSDRRGGGPPEDGVFGHKLSDGERRDEGVSVLTYFFQSTNKPLKRSPTSKGRSAQSESEDHRESTRYLGALPDEPSTSKAEESRTPRDESSKDPRSENDVNARGAVSAASKDTASSSEVTGKGKGKAADESSMRPRRRSVVQTPSIIMMESILSALPCTLRKLALSDCGLGDGHVSQVVRGLTSAKCPLEELDLSANDVTAQGAHAVFTWLEENDSLLDLNLSGNKMTSSCIDSLLRALEQHVQLQKLSLAGNYSFGEARVPDVLEAAREHANVLAALTEGAFFSLDISSIDVTLGAQNRLRETYKDHPNLKLRI